MSPCLIQLHWLPIRYRINYPQALHDHARSHRKVSALSGRHMLCYVMTLCSLCLPEWHAPVCAFSLKQPATSHLSCAPSLESALSLSSAQRHGTLPTELHTIPDTSVFKNKLKTYLLKLAFDILSICVLFISCFALFYSPHALFISYFVLPFLSFYLTFIVLHLCSYTSL